MSDKDIHSQVPEVLLFESSGSIHFPENHLDVYHTHIYCHSGYITFDFKGRTLEGKAGEFIFWYAHSAISRVECSNNFTATVLLVEENYLNSNLPDLNFSIDVLLHTRDNPVLQFNEVKNKSKVLKNFRDLNAMYSETDHTFYPEIKKVQMMLFTLEMWHVFAAEFERRKRSIQSGSLYDRFIHLVQEYCMTQREVQFYAERLNVTPKHLNFVCKQSTEVSASAWIQRFVSDRLILMLENETLGIAEIADRMEFSSRSFFTRYVKKVTGYTPSEYRRRNG